MIVNSIHSALKMRSKRYFQRNNFEGIAHRNLFLGIEIFTTVSFCKTLQNPAQCKLDDHETIITKLDNENDIGRFSEGMRRFTVCYLVQSPERSFETGRKRTT